MCTSLHQIYKNLHTQSHFKYKYLCKCNFHQKKINKSVKKKVEHYSKKFSSVIMLSLPRKALRAVSRGPGSKNLNNSNSKKELKKFSTAAHPPTTDENEDHEKKLLDWMENQNQRERVLKDLVQKHEHTRASNFSAGPSAVPEQVN